MRTKPTEKNKVNEICKRRVNAGHIVNNVKWCMLIAKMRVFVFFAVCLILAGIPQSAAGAQPVPVLLQNTVYIEQGEEYTLKTDLVPASGLVWSSSDKKTATVKDGVVRGKKAGFVQITVSAADDTSHVSKCRVVVKPKQVKGAHQIKTESRKLKVEWDKLKSCDGYRVYYREKGEKEYKLAKATKKTKAVLKDLAPETGYDIKVAAYVKSPGGKTDGRTSEKLRAYTAPEISSSTKITKITKGKLSFYRGQKIRFYTLEWKNAKDANAYQIYCRDKNNKPQLVTTVKKQKTTLYAALGYPYKICVVPCRIKHGITAFGKSSPEVTINSN